MAAPQRIWGMLVSFALMVAPATAGTRTFATNAKATTVDLYPDRVTRFPGGVTSLADVTYSVIPGYRPLVVDLYLPSKGKAAPKPLILYIHGGGWVGGNMRQSAVIADFPRLLASLATEGFVVASLEYRLSGEAPFPAQVQDARAAIRFLKTNAAKYGIDPARVALFGGSAGGHLTALTALSCGDASLDVKPEAAGSECVQGAVTWYGVFDFAKMLARPGRPWAGEQAARLRHSVHARANPARQPGRLCRRQGPAFPADPRGGRQGRAGRAISPRRSRNARSGCARRGYLFSRDRSQFRERRPEGEPCRRGQSRERYVRFLSQTVRPEVI